MDLGVKSLAGIRARDGVISSHTLSSATGSLVVVFIFNPIPPEFAQRISKPSEQAFMVTSAAGPKDAFIRGGMWLSR